AGAGTLALARKRRPNAISLDLGLSDIDGFVLLDLMKHDPDTRQVPIDVISGIDRSEYAMGMGAFGVTEKPAERAELVRVFSALREEAARQKPRPRKSKMSDEPVAVPRLVPELAGAKVLIVDDDIRNIFSLTSVLE